MGESELENKERADKEIMRDLIFSKNIKLTVEEAKCKMKLDTFEIPSGALPGPALVPLNAG